MINPFLYTERHLPVAVERLDLLPKRLLAWRRRPAPPASPAAPWPAPIAHGAVGEAGGPRRGPLLLRRIPR